MVLMADCKVVQGVNLVNHTRRSISILLIAGSRSRKHVNNDTVVFDLQSQVTAEKIGEFVLMGARSQHSNTSSRNQDITEFLTCGRLDEL